MPPESAKFSDDSDFVILTWYENHDGIGEEADLMLIVWDIARQLHVGSVGIVIHGLSGQSRLRQTTAACWFSDDVERIASMDDRAAFREIPLTARNVYTHDLVFDGHLDEPPSRLNSYLVRCLAYPSKYYKIEPVYKIGKLD